MKGSGGGVGVFILRQTKKNSVTHPRTGKSGRNYRRKIITLIRMEPQKIKRTAHFGCCHLFALSIFLCLGAVFNPLARAVDWEFKPPRIGLALAVENPNGTNWMVERRLASITAAPEFSFPLQLFYHSARTERGLFGDQWFCPQLESTLLPRGKDVLVWKTPSGSVVGLFLDETRAFHFVDREKKFLAKVAGIQTTIASNDGWVYTYRNGRLELVQAPTGRQLDFVYKASTLSQVILRDPSPNLSHPLLATAHDGRDRLTALTVGIAVYQFAYESGADGHLISFTRPGTADPEKIEYDKAGVLACIKPPSGAPSVFKTEYAKLDRNKQPDPNPKERAKVSNYRLVDDSVLWYFYGKDGAVTTSDRSGVWQSFQISKNRGTETSRNAAGEDVVKYYFLAPGRKHDGKLNRIEKNGRVVMENFYDKRNGNLIESRDENGICTTYEYSSDPAFSGKPTQIFRGTRDGKRELVVALQYDGAGRVIMRTEPGKRVTRYGYNARGELENVTDPAGIRTTIRRDAQGRVINTINGNNEERFSYDDAGRVKARTQPDGQTAEFTYDAAGNVSAVKQNGVTVVKYQRDKNGVVTAQTDAIGRTTRMERDAKGNLTAETQPNGTITKYEHDAAGHRTAQIDGKGNRITFKYDTGGHLVEQKNPLGQTLTWTYDAQGRLVGRTNGVQQVSKIYNDKGRLKMIDYGKPGEKIVYTYDDKGRVKKIATPTNSVALYYDDMNRIVAQQLTRGESQRVVRYGWDAAGRKTSVVLSEKVPDPKNATNYKLLQQSDYTYDINGRLVEIKSNGASACRYQYDAKGRLTGRQFGNGIVAHYAYDIFGRQTRLDLSGGPLVEPLLLAYQWDAAGQLLARTWNNETQTYGYDPSGQLLVVSKVGDSRSQAVTQVANNQTSPVLESYRYDAAGNMLVKFENGDTTSMIYDAANQLVSAVTGGKTTAFKYDTAGRLLSQTTDGQTQSRAYGFLDKVLVLTKPDGTRIGFDYYPDGQLAAKAPLPAAVDLNAPLQACAKKQTVGGMISNLLGSKPEENPLETTPEQTALNRNLREELVWDGLALLYCNGISYAVEPHVSGGVPLVGTRGTGAPPIYYINDILGTTLAVVTPDRVEIAPMTAFGKPRGGSGAPSTISEPSPVTPPSPETPSVPQQNPVAPVKGQN